MPLHRQRSSISPSASDVALIAAETIRGATAATTKYYMAMGESLIPDIGQVVLLVGV